MAVRSAPRYVTVGETTPGKALDPFPNRPEWIRNFSSVKYDYFTTYI